MAAVVAQIEVRHEAAVVPVEPREPLEHGVVAAEAGDVRRHGPVLAVHRVEAVDALAVEEVERLHGRQVPVEGRLPHGRDLAVVGLRVLRAEALHLLGRELGLAEGALRWGAFWGRRWSGAAAVCARARAVTACARAAGRGSGWCAVCQSLNLIRNSSATELWMKLQVVSAVLFSALAQTSGSGFTDASLDILVGDYSVRDTSKYNVCAPNEHLL